MKILTVVFLFISAGVGAQNFGGNPSSIKWRQVNNDAVRVIFPKGMDSVANRVATITEVLNSRHRNTVGTTIRKVNIVLNANNTLSNGYVQLGPYRSEFYLTQPQNAFGLGSLNWADNLALHEFRHIQQYSNYNVGISRVARFVLGEQGQALANAMSVPDWFFEGDAVWNETALSANGRGRLPAFFNGYKSLEMAGKKYPFMKLRNGSLRDYVPNHYNLGYLLVAYGREKYGDSVWNNITSDAAKFKGLFYPLQKAVQRNIGISYRQFTSDAMAFYQAQFQQEKTTPPTWLTTTEAHNVTDYKYPYADNNGKIITLKSSYRQVPTFVAIDSNGKEEKIAVRDISTDDYFSYRNGKIVYAALQPDLRWGNRDYSVIRLLNVADKSVTTITTKTKFFSPDINTEGTQIVVAQADPRSTSLLHIIDLKGNILQSFTADSALFYSQPKFSADGKNVFAVARQQNGEMGLLEWRLADGRFRWLMAPANHTIGYPVVVGEQLFFTESSGGKDGICSISLPDGKPVKLAVYPTGIYQGFVQQDKVVGAVFTEKGYRIGAFDITNAGKGQPLTGFETLRPMYVNQTLQNQENVSAVATKNFPVSKYNKAFRLFNFHSWQPDISQSDYKVSLLGENVLGTLQSELSYTYNTNEQSHKAGYQAVFGGSYIKPFVNVNQTWGRTVTLNRDTSLYYNETEAGLGLQLPLNLSFGKHYRFLTLQSSINTERVRWTGFAKDRYRNLDFNFLATRLTYISQIQKAAQHIYPRFAQTFVADYRTIVNNYTARQLLLDGALYLPGLALSHNLVLTAAYQKRDTLQQYIFGNSFPFSRGYSSINFPQMWKLGANYHFPIAYPDWGFGNMVYFQRLRMNVFYDYTSGKSLRSKIVYPFSTAGSELFFDTKIWNQLPVTIGVRYSRLLDKKYPISRNPNQWEIILPVNLY